MDADLRAALLLPEGVIEFYAIEGHEERYKVNNLGEVWAWRDGTRGAHGYGWHRLKPSGNGAGYLRVRLTKEGKADTRYVHRLVLEAFLGPCPDAEETRHLDGNPANNNLTNLAWGTKAEQQADKVRHGTVYTGGSVWGEDVHTAKLNPEKVRQIRRRRAAGETLRSLADAFGCHVMNIHAIVHRRTWKHVPDDPPADAAGEDGGE